MGEIECVHMNSDVLQRRAVLFDFHKTLCHDNFYESVLSAEHANVREWITKNIFQNSELVKEWMRGKTDWRSIHTHIVAATGIDRELLDRAFIESVKRMRLDEEMIRLAQELKQKGFIVAIVTDNMDIFSEITVPYHGLADVFDVIFNSADQTLLKGDEHGKLFAIVADKIGIATNQSILIDDSKKTTDLFRELGGLAITHTDAYSTREELFSIL